MWLRARVLWLALRYYFTPSKSKRALLVGKFMLSFLVTKPDRKKIMLVMKTIRALVR